MKDKGRALHLGIEIKNPLGCVWVFPFTSYLSALHIFCGLVWLCGVVCVLSGHDQQQQGLRGLLF